MKVGIIGLPQAGATTVFNALTGAHGEVGPGHRADATQMAVLKVPDERVDFLVGLFQPKKTVHATVDVEDCGGVFAHVGQAGVHESAQAVAEARAQDALLVVLRAFDDPTVPHPLGGVDPVRDAARIAEELLLADLAVAEGRIEKFQVDIKKPHPAAECQVLQEKLDLLERCRESIESHMGISSVQMSAAQEKTLRSYAFLTLKPRICVLNIGEGAIGGAPDLPGLDGPLVPMCAGLEMEIMELDEADRGEFMADAGLREPAAGAVVRECYAALGLRTFLTYGADEVRAWTVRAGETALDAADAIHSDIARGFIRAEVMALEDLRACGSIKETKAQGKFRLEGKTYEVQDGDVIIIRHSG